MTVDDFAVAADELRQRMPARPTREQWDQFFSDLIAMGPQGGLLEAYYLERDRQFSQPAAGRHAPLDELDRPSEPR